MSLYEFIRVLYYNWKLIVLSTLVPTLAIVFFTRNMERQYQSSTMLYTGIASGYSIESGDGKRIDYHMVNNAFDNLISLIKSRQTLEQVGLRLLTKHLLADGKKEHVGQQAYRDLQEVLPQASRDWIDTTSYRYTLDRAWGQYQAGDPVFRKLILGDAGPYSVKTLAKIEAKRVKSSDMVQLKYSYKDATISKQTLDVLLEVFISRYKELKSAETGDVVAYFEERLSDIKTRLTEAEDKLTTFRSKNRVINYGEQTKAIAIKKQNALEEYARRKMQMQANQAALQQIEEKLQVRKHILTQNAALLERKQALADVTAEIAKKEALEKTEELPNMLDLQKRLKQQIKMDVHKLFNYSNTKEGLPNQQLLNDWLDHLIDVKKEQVQVELFTRRLAELNAEYDRFAPLGSTIDRYEREIDVFEREYLEVLHGLNMAKLKQQNIQLSSTLKVLDSPKYPMDPMAGKRLLMVLACFLFGLIASVGSIVLFELLDTSLREPGRAEKLTKMSALGVFPEMENNPDSNMALPLLLDQFVDQLLIESDQENQDKKIIALGSTMPGTGKTYIGALLKQHIELKGYTCCVCHGSDEPEVERLSADVVLIEMPSLVKGGVPLDLLKKVHTHLFVERADRSWGSANKRCRDFLFRHLDQPKMFITLNLVKRRFLDSVLGDWADSGSLKGRIKGYLKLEPGKTLCQL